MRPLNGHALLTSLLWLAPAALDQSPYWKLETFRQLTALAPEVSEPRPRGLAPGGMELWTRNELRLPETPSTTLQGDLRGLAQNDRAVVLETGEPGKTRSYLLIATRSGERWIRLFLDRIHESGDLVWDDVGKVLALDTGERRRRTRAATMTWENGRGTSQHGYVLEDWRVVPYVWDAGTKQFRRGEPYWLESKQ